MQTVILPIKDVHPNPENPRIIKNDKFKKLVKSIQEFPEMLKARPIVLNASNIVLGGNMRLKAAKDAGLKEIPCLIVDWMTEEQEKEFIIKDNSSYGDWDWEIFKDSDLWDISDLLDWGIDVPSSLLEEDKEPEFDEDRFLQAAQSYVDNTIKGITLFYEHSEYEEIQKDFELLQKTEKLDDKSVCVQYLMKLWKNSLPQ